MMMTLTLDLTPEQQAALMAEATARGTDEIGVIQQWIDGLQATSAALRARRARDLFAEWDREDEAMSEEEAAQAEQDWQKFQTAMNANRTAQGERPVF